MAEIQTGPVERSSKCVFYQVCYDAEPGVSYGEAKRKYLPLAEAHMERAAKAIGGSVQRAAKAIGGSVQRGYPMDESNAVDVLGGYDTKGDIPARVCFRAYLTMPEIPKDSPNDQRR